MNIQINTPWIQLFCILGCIKDQINKITSSWIIFFDIYIKNAIGKLVKCSLIRRPKISNIWKLTNN